MLIAKQKKKENIAEYILYMWQIEDIIRAYNFDLEKIKNNIVFQYKESEETITEITTWYADIIEMMKLENVLGKGHIQLIKNSLLDLTDIHLRLLNTPEQIQYHSLYYKTLPFLLELKNKSSITNDIEVALNALYGFLLLNIQKKEISEETKKALKQISELISSLSKKYQEEKTGKLELL